MDIYHALEPVLKVSQTFSLLICIRTSWRAIYILILQLRKLKFSVIKESFPKTLELISDEKGIQTQAVETHTSYS